MLMFERFWLICFGRQSSARATIVIATHDSEFVSPLAQRVLRLDAGRIVNEMTPNADGPEVLL